MSENSFITLFVSFYVFISVIGISSTEYVPVYMWETTQFPEIVPALDRLSQESFKKIISDRTTTKTPVLVFAEQNLSPEDFNLRDVEGNSPFFNVALLKKSAQVSYWPFVKNPIKACTELPDRNKVEASITSIIDDPNFTMRDNDLLIVDLNDAGEGEDRIQMLKRHDKDIVTIYERLLRQHKNLITLFTAHHPSWIISEELRSHRRARDITKTEAAAASPAAPVASPAAPLASPAAPLASPAAPLASPAAAASPAADDAEGTYHIYNNTDVLIYLSNTGNVSDNGTIIPMSGYTLSTVNKSDTDMFISLSTQTPKKISVVFGIEFGGYWKINDVTLKINDKDYPLKVREVYAPVGFSYHCSAQSFASMDHPKIYVLLPGFQIQPTLHETKVERFGDAYDCVGFMTAPIWSGLFVTFILALIMTFGLTMMMDIKTMDRFDDPKGKTITISATE